MDRPICENPIDDPLSVMVDAFKAFDDYQEVTADTAVYPGHHEQFGNPYYPALGLAGEAGEACNKIKKVMRDRGGVFDEESIFKITDELGDVLWYVAQLGMQLGMPMSLIAARNILKLQERAQAGAIQGDGDQR